MLLTTSKWINLDLGIKTYEKELISFEIPKNLIKETEMYNKLEILYKNFKEKKLEEEFSNFLAYLYQALKTLTISRKKIINEINYDEIKQIENVLFFDEIKKINIINYFCLNKNLKAIGSEGIELGLNAFKDFNYKRIYLILKIYLETIFNSIIEFIVNKNKNNEIKIFINLLKKEKENEEISFYYFKKFKEKENINKISILDSIIGSEILILSFSLSEKHFKNSVFSILTLKKENNIEETLFPIYEEIDKKIENKLILLNFKKEEINEIISNLKFSNRKIC